VGTVMDDLLKNLPQILEYVTPTSYLDIGANKGEMIPYVKQQLPSITKIEAIEACRFCEWELNQLKTQMNVFYRLEVLSDSVKTVDLYLDHVNSSYYKEDSPEFLVAPTEVRETNTLDNIYPSQSFDLIKIDTQGSELDILRGGISLISRSKAIIVEENTIPYNIGSPTYSEVRAFLESHEFVFVKHLRWSGSVVLNSRYEQVYKEEADALYIHKSILKTQQPLPISVGILAWHSGVTLENTLESYRKNGLFDVVDDVCILFQEVTPEDKALARKYGIPYIGLDKNVGIGRAFVMLCEQADNQHVLLLEHDWELTENMATTRSRLEAGLDMLKSDTDVVRFRSRINPGLPLYTYDSYYGKELDHFCPNIELPSPHLMDCIHWIDHPEEMFPGKIFIENYHYVATSRYSNWTNNPCLHRRDFYIELVSWFADKDSTLLLEPTISHWWARQQFKIAWGEGLFTHNDIGKYQQE
jgi:FkbM family methyltransferase